MGRKSYDPASKSSPHSTPLARFQKTRLPISESVSSELRAVLEARCEVDTEDTVAPVTLVATTSVLAELGCRGWKNRDPYLKLFRFEHKSQDGSWLRSLGHLSPGLSGIATTMVIDNTRKLVYVADDDRIKSFEWDYEEEDGGLSLVHTMDSYRSGGPLGLIDGGARLLRAGMGRLQIWDVNSAPLMARMEAILSGVRWTTRI